MCTSDCNDGPFLRTNPEKREECGYHITLGVFYFAGEGMGIRRGDSYFTWVKESERPVFIRNEILICTKFDLSICFATLG